MPVESATVPDLDDPEVITHAWVCDECQWVAGTPARARAHYIARGHGCREALVDENGNEWIVR